MKAECGICPHRCKLEEGQTGICKGRANRNGEVVAINAGKLTSIALDPIEKKPFAMFHPGSMILSVGSFGCNLRCPFCQNADISTAGEGDSPVEELAPAQLAGLAEKLVPQGNIGVAYTYNEPLISYEWVLDCCKAVRALGLLNAHVTNGMILEEPLKALLPYTDAMNIDLKGFTQKFYDWVGGDLETVKNAIRVSVRACHVEVTTLVIPGMNDDPGEMRREAEWLASLDPAIPLHITRFFPRHKVMDRPPTPIETIDRLATVAREFLHNVFLGNC